MSCIKEICLKCFSGRLTFLKELNVLFLRIFLGMAKLASEDGFLMGGANIRRPDRTCSEGTVGDSAFQ